jgi:hypothetical protein
MRLPAIAGLIDRRILVNYRVDPEVAARWLPRPFRPKLAGGYAMAGICLIRLKHVRPAFIPLAVGLASENAAHRFAVEWDQNGSTRQGVYIPRRDSSSRLSALLGGRLVPGEHHHAQFIIEETDDRLHVEFQSDDGTARINVIARPAAELTAGSIFASIDDASRFYEGGALGYSATRDPTRYDGIELQCKSWSVQPLEVDTAESSFFDDVAKFPIGSVVFDSALLMRGIQHLWHTRKDLCCDAVAVEESSAPAQNDVMK